MYGLIKMKNKRYCVTYSYRTSFDTTVKARTQKEAEEKVREVIGDCRLEGTWEVKEKTNANISNA